MRTIQTLHKAQKNVESNEAQQAERIATVAFNNTKNGQPQEKRKNEANQLALNTKLASFVVVLGINVLIVQRTSAFVANSTAGAILQMFIKDKENSEDACDSLRRRRRIYIGPTSILKLIPKFMKICVLLVCPM